MQYLRALGLAQEPFSTSPDPEFFYPSRQHQECLHRLEIAVRLRRGLCVVLGDVGTGKTTVCRQFLRSLDADPALRAHLLLDPHLSSPEEFLAVLCHMVSGQTAQASEGAWHLKERLKNALFAQAVAQELTLVLVIDEGQKLTPACLELLRELLNYETNAAKLLQIVIFAQQELSASLRAQPNLADRIHEALHLRPLSFADTRAMIHHRLDLAKAGTQPPRPFNLGALWAIQRASGGYPRRMLHLCHQVLLACLLTGSTRAGYWTVRRCAASRQAAGLPVAPLGLPRSVGVGVALLVVVGLLALRQPLARWLAAPSSGQSSQEIASPTSPAQATPQPAVNDALATSLAAGPQPLVGETPGAAMASPEPAPMSPGGATPEPLAAAPAPLPPSLLGSVPAVAGESLSALARTVYGAATPSIMNHLLAANPRLRRDQPLRVGTKVVFPALARASGPVGQSGHWLQLAEAAHLEIAMDHWRQARRQLREVRLVSLWRPDQGLRFVVVRVPAYAQAEAAQVALEGLPVALKMHAQVRWGWPEGTVFLAAVDPAAEGHGADSPVPRPAHVAPKTAPTAPRAATIEQGRGRDDALEAAAVLDPRPRGPLPGRPQKP